MNWYWMISNDFPIIAKQINNVLLFAKFSEIPIPNHNAVAAGMKIIIYTGLFEQKYKEWHK